MKELFIKFITKTINEVELNQLYRLLEDPNNQSKFVRYLKDHHDVNSVLQKNNLDEAYNKVLKLIDNNSKPVKKLMPRWSKYVAAASIALLISLPFIFNRDKIKDTNTSVVVNNNIVAGTDKAVLTLENGSSVPLEKGHTYTNQNLNSTGESLIYTASKKETKETQYNYLTTPRGGQYHLTLTDGTNVWLNAESQIKYPIVFTEGETRRVELVYGEAYFDVTSSDQNGGASFIVSNKLQDIEVLGTEFNVKAYNDENVIYTTLVEGKVTVSTVSESKTLSPNQQSVLNKENTKISITNIEVKTETAWIKGQFILQNKSLKEIMKVLSRWYDMDVDFANKDLEKVKFIGALHKDQSILDILNTIKSFNVIKDYEINDKQVILK